MGQIELALGHWHVPGDHQVSLLFRYLILWPARVTLPLHGPAASLFRRWSLCSTEGSPEIRYARSSDLRIAYQVVGTGPLDLVFVPGFV